MYRCKAKYLRFLTNIKKTFTCFLGGEIPPMFRKNIYCNKLLLFMETFKIQVSLGLTELVLGPRYIAPSEKQGTVLIHLLASSETATVHFALVCRTLLRSFMNAVWHQRRQPLYHSGGCRAGHKNDSEPCFDWSRASSLEPATMSGLFLQMSTSWGARTPLLMSPGWFLWVKACHKQWGTGALWACTSFPSLGAELLNARIAQERFGSRGHLSEGNQLWPDKSPVRQTQLWGQHSLSCTSSG